jgi:hypothetical protein
MKMRLQNLRTFSYAEEGMLSADDVGEGRMIPVIVLDVENNQDVIDLIKSHYSIVSGDVTLTWSQDFFNRKELILKMSFTKPMKVEFGIRFIIATDVTIIDGIIQSKGVYLQTGKKGDKVSKKLNDEKILIEVPEMGIKEFWNNLLQKTLIVKYKKLGLSKKESKGAALQHIQSIRELWKIRRNDK